MPTAARRTPRKTSSTSKPLEVLRAQAFAEIPWLVHGFSTRQGGVSACYDGKSLNLGLTAHDTEKNVVRNRELFLKAVGAVDDDSGLWPLAQLHQIHSAIVHRVDKVPTRAPSGDGLISQTAGVLLAIKTADCVPVLMADAKRRVVGAFHAGWRGTAARVVEKGVGEMRRQFGSAPSDLRAAIGPCIRKCCYSVGDEVRAEFESQFTYATELFEEVFDYNALHLKYPMLFLNQRAPGHGEPAVANHLDLVAANTRQLYDAGLEENHISIIDGCTACDTKRFFSHRAEFGNTGRMMAVIGMTNPW